MKKYTVIYSIALAVEIEANDNDEAIQTAKTLNGEWIIENRVDEIITLYSVGDNDSAWNEYIDEIIHFGNTH